MSIVDNKFIAAINRIKANGSIAEVEQGVKNDSTLPDSIPHFEPYSEQGKNTRLEFLKAKTGAELEYVSGKKQFTNYDTLSGNIENFIGMAQVPIGVIGPIRIAGTAARGDFFVPLATTEGALVASYNRGARACLMSGPMKSVCILEGIQRSPLFQFKDLIDLGKFAVWVSEHLDDIKRIVSESSKYAVLSDMRFSVEGNNLFLSFEYRTGDAAGQNMVTFCTYAVCKFLIENSPVKPVLWYIESNYSGDKKATAMSFMHVRGKKVVVELVLPRNVVRDVLKTTPEKMAEYCRLSTTAAIQTGSIGAQGHIANGLAAIFIATGQDVACVSEASTGLTRFDVNPDGDLYASLTVPNLVVGTVGGGTHLPTQRECLELMECSGKGTSQKFAEICAAMLLAGELSIVAALTSDAFVQAHKLLGRKNK